MKRSISPTLEKFPTDTGRVWAGPQLCGPCPEPDAAAPQEKCQFGGHRKKLCDNEECNVCFERSFASIQDAVEMLVIGPNGTNPRLNFKSTNAKATFKCTECDHEFDHQSVNFTSGHRCPFCSGRQLCNDSTCSFCFQRSAASFSTMLKSAANGKPARELPKHSQVSCVWHCTVCLHEWTAPPDSIAPNGSGCPFCAIHGGRLCDDLQCVHCFNRSLASFPFASAFRCVVVNSRVMDQNMRSILMNSGRKGRWYCEEHGEWDADICNVTRGNGCPSCMNSTESLLLEWFGGLTHEVTPQWRRRWCSLTRTLPFDFHVELEVPSIVELDGIQHFQPVSRFGGQPRFDEQRRNDLHKMRCAIAKGLPVVRLLTRTVREDKKDWRAWLLHVFEHRCNLREGVAPLILQDTQAYRRMHAECLHGDPLIPIVEFVAMP